jgi:hypothetical protein
MTKRTARWAMVVRPGKGYEGECDGDNSSEGRARTREENEGGWEGKGMATWRG